MLSVFFSSQNKNITGTGKYFHLDVFFVKNVYMLDSLYLLHLNLERRCYYVVLNFRVFDTKWLGSQIPVEGGPDKEVSGTGRRGGGK